MAILSIGAELCRGDTLDTNATFIAAEATASGAQVVEKATVPDDLDAIAAAVARHARLADAVVATGGLGPTSDDVTAEAVARAAGAALREDVATLAAIRDRFARHGLAMSPNNARQARVPGGATVIPNAGGTAPGFALRIAEANVYVLPGVPAEMRPMFAAAVAPRLRDTGAAPGTRVLRVFGLPESEIGARLEGVEAARPGVRLGYRIAFPEVEVRVTAPDDAGAAAAAATVRERVGRHVYGEGGTRLPEVVGRALDARGWTLGVAESCTGGLVGELVTSVPGSSRWFAGGVVAYADRLKTALAGVPETTLRDHGAVSRETAVALAHGARRLVADPDRAVGLGVTGIAGPGGATNDKPVGLVHLAAVWPGGERHVERRLPGERAHVRAIAAWAGLRIVLDACTGEAT